jgi:hypothetical protein
VNLCVSKSIARPKLVAGIREKETLLYRPVLAATWQSFVIASLLVGAGSRAISARGDVDQRDQAQLGSTPAARRGFHFASADLKPERRFFVYPEDEAFRLADELHVMSLAAFAAEVAERSR